jgi:hypothetical protein
MLTKRNIWPALIIILFAAVNVFAELPRSVFANLHFGIDITNISANYSSKTGFKYGLGVEIPFYKNTRFDFYAGYSRYIGKGNYEAPKWKIFAGNLKFYQQLRSQRALINYGLGISTGELILKKTRHGGIFAQGDYSDKREIKAYGINLIGGIITDMTKKSVFFVDIGYTFYYLKRPQDESSLINEYGYVYQKYINNLYFKTGLGFRIMK